MIINIFQIAMEKNTSCFKFDYMMKQNSDVFFFSTPQIQPTR